MPENGLLAPGTFRQIQFTFWDFVSTARRDKICISTVNLTGGFNLLEETDKQSEHIFHLNSFNLGI